MPHPWQRQPSRRKISCRQVVVLFGASRSRGCWYEPDSRCRPTQSHASQPQTHAVCSPRAELESLVHHPIFRPLHIILLKTEYLLGSFRNWHLFRQFRIGSAAGAIIGSGKTRVPFKKTALHKAKPSRRVPIKRVALLSLVSPSYCLRIVFCFSQSSN